MNKEHFFEVIDFFKLNTDPLSIYSTSAFFEKIINDLKQLSLKNNISLKNKTLIYNKTVLELFELRAKVYDKRKQQTLTLINENRNKLKMSTFELMEHDFRENTHSNILKFIFDYDLTYGFATKSLFKFLDKINDSIPQLEEKINKKQYTIEREKSTGNGRIDLLIYDTSNKFVIVIENKLLANISYEEEDSNDENEKIISRTQLDNYKEFIEAHFKDFNKLYLILSYKPVEDIYSPIKF